MTDQSNAKYDARKESRRATLKKMLAGGGAAAAVGALPVKWPRPVVNALVLPAHAAASGATTSGTTHFYGEITVRASASINPLERGIDALISPAYAKEVAVGTKLSIDVSNGGGRGAPFFAKVALDQYSGHLSGDNLTARGRVNDVVLLKSVCDPPHPGQDNSSASGNDKIYIQVIGTDANFVSFRLGGNDIQTTVDKIFTSDMNLIFNEDHCYQ